MAELPSQQEYRRAIFLGMATIAKTKNIELTGNIQNIPSELRHDLFAQAQRDLMASPELQGKVVPLEPDKTFPAGCLYVEPNAFSN